MSLKARLKARRSRATTLLDGRVTLCRGTVAHWLPKLKNKFHACFCDPPYHLTDGKASAGFMGKGWDSGNVAFQPETWEAIYDVLLPGAFVVAFGSRRTYHWLAVAVEQAGFDVRDQLLWMYGQGMPKNVDIAKQIDKKAGVIRPIVGKRCVATDQWTVEGRKHHAKGDPNYYVEVTAPATKDAQMWEGYGTDLKPAFEPAVLARVPVRARDTMVDHVLRFGTGVLNIDGSRIEVKGEKLHVPQSDPKKRKGMVGADLGISKADKAEFQKAQRESVAKTQAKGRWPSQVVLQHHRECECVGVMTVKGRTIKRFTDGAKPFGGGAGHEYVSEKFPDESVPVYHCHPDCPLALLEGRSSGASRFFYCTKATTKEKNEGLPDGLTNDHPAVKPVDLCRYIAKLLLPPKGRKKRRILVPFAGTGSEMLGCLEAGWDEVVGIEYDRKTATVCQHRLAAWHAK